jgi:DNA-binding NarL/FixJ family response regulator
MDELVDVVIVARMRLYREALTLALGRSPAVRVSSAVARPSEMDPAAPAPGPRVVLVDAAAETGPSAVPALLAQVRPAPVIVLGSSASVADFLAYAEAGAAGYLTEESSTDELLSMIVSVARGELPCAPRVAAALFRHVGLLAADHRVSRAEDQLSRREREIVRLIDDGLSNKEIASRLSITLATVKNHVHNILGKLDVRTRSDAAACLHGRT